MMILFANFGNDSMALIQWAINTLQPDEVTVVSIETHWAAPTWSKRVEHVRQYVTQHHLHWKRIPAKLGFSDLVKEKNSFPNETFQWCAGLLKGLPLLSWLDRVDPCCECTLLLPHRRQTARTLFQLTEFKEENEHYGGRKTWFPLYATDTSIRNRYIQQTGLPILNHPAQECSPCINCTAFDLKQLPEETIEKTVRLEKEINQTMFDPLQYHQANNLRDVWEWLNQSNTQTIENTSAVEMGCGTPYGCGL